ncbi:polysaccharide chain length determinant protein (PEP-CTERM system associated) [Pararhizobium capsulatum DSM 1112]|uniref:Polysaccharide chain length determinant protein (PEP-CTERM system associated) n=1 Tax=Pararhizobium capsulatum DSM 1112 TaxID=1121113 RepID=A0ABU0BVA1_9HYPH|nr:lipopolysaccharide biosynthesis protein [Pararhizobium capsulatum]MDQ0322180.1 polysaccharide chain length determinant protein (PEP-CTERM system associated) [Pararhizobium capsulatum DSM 1112]
MGDTDVRFYLSILIRRLPYMLAIAASVLLLAVVATRVLPTVYSANARILAENPQIPAELARSTVPTGPAEQLQIVQQQITARDNLLTLAEHLGIYEGSDTPPAPEDIVADMRSRIGFEQTPLDEPGGAIVFNVAFEASDPVVAANVANEIAAMILGRNQQQRTDRAGNTLKFFDQEVAKLGDNLNRIEAEILKFKNANKDTLPENLEFRRSQQSLLQGRLATLEQEEAELRTRRSNLIVAYAGAGQLSGTTPITPEQQMLAELNRALAEQLAIFSESSPSIKALRARINSLQSRLVLSQPKSEEKTDRVKADDASKSFGLDLQLSDIDDRLQSITREKTTIAQRVSDLTKSITATPASETALNSLERNRENVQTQYNSAIARRAEASTGEQIEMRADGGRFSLLEEATPPTSPISPRGKRILMLGAVLGAGLALGYVVLLELLNRTVRRPAEVVRLLEAYPLAVVPNIRPTAYRRRAPKRRSVFARLSAAVLPTLAAAAFYHVPLKIAFERLLGGLSGT